MALYDSLRPARPLFALSLAYCAGVGASVPASTLVAAGMFPCILGALYFATRERSRLALACLLLLAFLAGAARAPRPSTGTGIEAGTCARALLQADLPPPTDEGAVRLELEGTVEGAPSLGPRSNRFTLRMERARQARDPHRLPDEDFRPASLRIEAFAKKDWRPLPGDEIRAVAILDDPPPLGPAARRAAKRRLLQGIPCVAHVEEGRIAVIREGGGLAAWIEAHRRRLAAGARSRLKSEASRALVPALMVGDRSEVPESLQESFTASGLSHILSVSGLHLSLTVLGFFRILRFALGRLAGHRIDAHRAASLLALPLAPLYAAFTGAEAPVLRAAVGAGLFLLAQAWARSADSWTSLGVAALGILAWEPSALFEPSFQLSFAACAGLLGLSPSLRSGLPLRRPAPGSGLLARAAESLLTSFTTTLAATLATLPLVALHFNRFSLSSLAANVAAVPVGLAATALSAVAGAAGLLAPWWMEAILPLAGWTADLLAWCAAFFASLPGSRIPLPVPTLADWLGGFAAIASAFFLRSSLRQAGLALLLAASLLTAPRLLSSERRELIVDFLPVGQGDATLLRLPGGEAILVDTGGDLRGARDLASTVLLPLLAERGVVRLRALILSHLHPDHVGSVPSLLRHLPVDEVWFTGRALEGRWGAPIAEAMEARRIPLVRLAAGAPSIEIGPVRFDFLAPPDREGLGDDPLLGDNDASLVVRVVHGEVRILLPGDIEKEGERLLLASGADLRADLLKAPHHGSRTSSTPALLRAVRPSHVVFCVGWRNLFGFPHRDVVERYERLGVEIHRTDRGAVRFVSDGRTLELQPQPRRDQGLLERAETDRLQKRLRSAHGE